MNIKLENSGLLVFTSLVLIAYTSRVFEFMLNSKHLINFIDVLPCQPGIQIAPDLTQALDDSSINASIVQH